MEQIPKPTKQGPIQPGTAARRRPIYPAIYLVTAAALVLLFWYVQGHMLTPDSATSGKVTANKPSSSAVATLSEADEVLHWPVQTMTDMQVVTPYYSASASATEKAAAMLQVGDTFTPSSGISIARKDGGAFDVLAAKSGTVTRVETLPMVGKVVEITHAGKQKTVYDALDSVNVHVNDKIAQGAVIGQAGRNELEKGHGIHVHFELFNNGTAVDPTSMLSPSVETSSTNP